QRRLISQIEYATKSKMKEGKLPTRKEIAVMRMNQSLSQFNGELSNAQLLPLLDKNWVETLDQLSKPEIAARFLAMMHPDLAQPEIKIPDRQESDLRSIVGRK